MSGISKSLALPVSGIFTAPAGVSEVWVSQIGAGGGGSASVNTLTSGVGGGSGEFCQRVPYKVTPLGTITVTVGAAGLGSASTDGGAGGATIFGTLRAGGGFGGENGTSKGGSGGGAGGGVGLANTTSQQSYNATVIANRFVGGVPGGSAGTASNGAQGTNSLNGKTGGAGGGSFGAGGGAASPYANGAAGGASGTNAVAAPVTSFGVGGGGGGSTGSGFKSGGDGGPGYCVVEWLGEDSPADPYYASDVFLWNGAGAAGQNTLTNLAPAGPATLVGSAALLSTTQHLYGPTSVPVSTTGRFSTASALAALAFGTAAFTLEWYTYITSVTTANQFDMRPGANGVFPLFYSLATGEMNLYVNSATKFSTAAGVLTANSWIFWAYSKQNGSAIGELSKNGTVVGSWTDTSNYDNAGLSFGDNVTSLGPTGFMGPCRVTKGVARYFGNFTPPSAAFPES